MAPEILITQEDGDESSNKDENLLADDFDLTLDSF